MPGTTLFVPLAVALGMVLAVIGADLAPSTASAAPVGQRIEFTGAFQDDDDDGGGGGVVAVPRTGVGSSDAFNMASAPLIFGGLAVLFGGAAYLRRDGLQSR